MGWPERLYADFGKSNAGLTISDNYHFGKSYRGYWIVFG